MISKGRIFVLGIPIGNFKDISLRGLEALKDCDFVICERTSQALKLLRFFAVSAKKIISHTEANRAKSIPEILSLLTKGETACLITDAGTPGISDPGSDLVNQVRKAGFEVTSLPGPSALTAAISISGERINHFVFVGFLPRKKGELIKLYNQAVNSEAWLVGFESPFRLEKTLRYLPEDTSIILVGEISKLHEKVIKGNPQEILSIFIKDKNISKGEFVVFMKSA